MPDPNLVHHVLTVAMWIVFTACVLGVAICFARMRRAAGHLADTPSADPIDSTDHHRTSKEN